MDSLQHHLTRHVGRRESDVPRNATITGETIREIAQGYTFRVVYSGTSGRIAVALPTRRQRQRIKRELAEGMEGGSYDG